MIDGRNRIFFIYFLKDADGVCPPFGASLLWMSNDL